MSEIKRILLVEDHRRDLELTLTALEECNLANEVTVVRDGAAALDFLRTCLESPPNANARHGLPALVLLDIKLPKLNGLEVLARMKSDPRLRKIPVVMLTSSREDPDLDRSYELGVNAYVVKPLDLQQFISAVKQTGAFWAVLNETPRGLARRPG